MTRTADKNPTMIRQINVMRSAPGFAAVAILLAGQVGCSGGEAEIVETTGSVVALGPQDVTTVEMATMSSGIVLTSTLNPYLQVEVKAQVPGVVSALNAERGQAVPAGAVLARIEAQGITSQAAGARSGVAAGQANLALAQRQLESARTLYEAGAMSEIDFRMAQTQFEAAQAQLAASQAQAAGAAEQAGRTAVVSPISGQVSERSVSQGEAVDPGQTLFRVVNSGFLELEGQVPVDQATAVREGQAVVFTMDAYPGQELRGTVARVAPVADPSTRQVGVVMRLPNESGSLIGGLFATGRVITEAETQAMVVPTAALRGAGATNFVYVVENETIVRKPVTAGARDPIRGVVAITTGLRAGERVVITPGEITEGARVQNPAAQPAATTEGA